MPPKRKTAAAAPSRPSRATKTKAKETIHRVILPKGRRAAAIVPPPAPSSPARSLSAPVVDLEALGDLISSMPQIQGLESRFQDLDASLADSQIAIRSTLHDTFSQIMDRLDEMEARLPLNQGETNQGTDPHDPPRDVLSRWPWIEKSTIEVIANGEFDINNLPKLHREEEPRNRHQRKVIEGMHFPTDGSKPELITGRTKMQAAFPNLPTFLSAWLMYVSIRSSYSPERGPGLVQWTERLVFHLQAGFQWSVVLNYAIAYFLTHQNSPPESWFLVDAEMVANHFAIAQRSTTSISAETAVRVQPAKKSPSKTSASLPIERQTCTNWNREHGSGCTWKEKHGEKCPRQHRCLVCEEPGHKAFQCPKRSA